MSLFQRGAFQLHSGKDSWWKVECDALDWEDWLTLAELAIEAFPHPIGKVVSVPRGGDLFASALSQYSTRDESDATVIVDDVLTSGGSLLEVMAQHPGSYGIVAFSRGFCPPRVLALWQLGNYPLTHRTFSPHNAS